MTITTQQLHSIAPNLKEPKLSIYTQSLNSAMDAYNISTPSQQAMFLAQVMHESGECRYVQELASGKAYENRKDLGNVNVGDGVKYKGRGLIQITGKSNYQQLSTAFGVNFIESPSLLEQPEYATKSAAWFWDSRNLNSYAEPSTEAGFLKVTRKINGGTNGLDDRKKYWERAKVQLEVEEE